MTPYSAAAAGSRSSRASSRSAALRTSSGNSSESSRSRSSFTSACSGSASPSSSWIAFSCWRRKNSRCPSSSCDCTCDWIFVPSSKTWSSRLRIFETSRSRSSVSASSRISCFSSVFSRSVEATRLQRLLASSTFAAAIESSSGRYGARPMIRPKRPWAFRSSASSSRVSSASSGRGEKRATRYGSPATGSSSRIRRRPWTRIRSVPSGTRIILCTTAAVPIS